MKKRTRCFNLKNDPHKSSTSFDFKVYTCGSKTHCIIVISNSNSHQVAKGPHVDDNFQLCLVGYHIW